MSSLSYFQMKVNLDRKTIVHLFNRNNPYNIGIWVRAIIASMKRLEVDFTTKRIKNYYFDYNAEEEGVGMTESSSFLELAFTAGFEEKEELYCTFREMVKTAILENILIDVTGQNDVYTEEGYRSYAFPEVMETITSYLYKDPSKVLGGVLSQAKKETKDVIVNVRKKLSKSLPCSKDSIDIFCSTYVKDHTEEIERMDDDQLIELFYNHTT